MKKLIRITTVSLSIDAFLKGQLAFLSKHFEVIGVASGEEDLRKVSEREGIRTINIPMSREIAIWQDIQSLVLFLVKDIVNEYADEMYVHFAMDGAESTRDNIWVQENDFFRKAPLGMFEAFYGPTFSEMAAKPTHLIAGLESLFMLGLFVYLSWKMLSRFLATYRFNATIVPVYFIIFSGICLLHYPFGIFNPGSAIRYRANFIFLFILLLLHLYVRYKKNTVFTK